MRTGHASSLRATDFAGYESIDPQPPPDPGGPPEPDSIIEAWGTFTVPNVSCAGFDASYDTMWVGTGTDRSLDSQEFQAGLSWNCAGDSTPPVYLLWWDDTRNVDRQFIRDFSPSPGDIIVIDVDARTGNATANFWDQGPDPDNGDFLFARTFHYSFIPGYPGFENSAGCGITHNFGGWPDFGPAGFEGLPILRYGPSEQYRLPRPACSVVHGDGKLDCDEDDICHPRQYPVTDPGTPASTVRQSSITTSDGTVLAQPSAAGADGSFTIGWSPNCTALAIVSGPTCGGLEARPRVVPATVIRGGSVTLNGSDSQPASDGSTITTWDWTVEPGPECPPDVLTTTFTGEVVGPFVMLCGVTVSLVVQDDQGGTSAPASVELPVTARDLGHIKVNSIRDADGDDTQALPEDPGLHDIGLNISGCPGATSPRDDNKILCPLKKDGSYFKASAYSIERVPLSDGGPFAGLWYVRAAHFDVIRRGIVQRALGPQGAPPPDQKLNYLDYNTRADAVFYPGFRKAVLEHENMGAPGHLDTGHSGLIQKRINEFPFDDENNVIEPYVAVSADALKSEIEVSATNADSDLDQESSDDKIQRIGEFELFHWYAVKHAYVPATCIVTGTADNRRPCERDTEATLGRRPHGVYHPGQTIIIWGDYFTPHETITLTLKQTGTDLGTDSALRDGFINSDVTLPETLKPGLYTVKVVGKTSGVSGSIDFRVRAAD